MVYPGIALSNLWTTGARTLAKRLAPLSLRRRRHSAAAAVCFCFATLLSLLPFHFVNKVNESFVTISFFLLGYQGFWFIALSLWRSIQISSAGFIPKTNHWCGISLLCCVIVRHLVYVGEHCTCQLEVRTTCIQLSSLTVNLFFHPHFIASSSWKKRLHIICHENYG